MQTQPWRLFFLELWFLELNAFSRGFVCGGGVFLCSTGWGRLPFCQKQKKSSLVLPSSWKKSSFFCENPKWFLKAYFEKKKSHMRCNSSQCDQYFTKCVKFTHSSTYSFLKTSIFISLLGKKPLYQVLSRKYDKLFWTRGKSLNLEDELEVGGSLWWRGIMSQEGEWKAGHVVGPRQSGLPSRL